MLMLRGRKRKRGELDLAGMDRGKEDLLFRPFGESARSLAELHCICVVYCRVRSTCVLGKQNILYSKVPTSSMGIRVASRASSINFVSKQHEIVIF